ncbi:MAG TPA: FkbM family methyltransferase [Chryseolinea sp.]|nr:FkbM family methyltransferase [Chryseolinea sp.]
MLEGVKSGIRKIFSRKFPRKVSQTVLNNRLVFEVHNVIEEDRVTGSNSEIEFTEEIINELQRKDVYFDIGSCIGFTAISAAKHSGCRVYAFEPDSELFQHLNKNISINEIADQVKPNQWAVSDTDGTMDFFTSGANGASPSLAKTQDQSNKVTVKTYKIDTAIKLGLLKTPDVVKLDIEGAELIALQGMSTTLSGSTAPRTIFIESHPKFLPHFHHSVAMLQQFLKDKNYKEVYMKERSDENHHKFVKI